MRTPDELSLAVLRQYLSSVSKSEMSLSWQLAIVDRDFQSFLEYKTSGDAQSTCEAHEFGGFESFRRLNAEYDPVTKGTKGALMTGIVGMMKKTAKNPKELKALVRELDMRVKTYKMKLGSSPEPSVVESVFTGLLDPETTRILIQRDIYGDYDETRKVINLLQAELPEFGGSDAMDLSVCVACGEQNTETIQPTNQGGTLAPCGPANPSQANEGTEKGTSAENPDNLPAWVLSALGKGGKGKGATCYNCGGTDHFARDCKNAYNPAAWRPSKGGGKSSGKNNNYKGGGKGGKSKGKGKGSKGSAYSVSEAEWQWPSEEYRSLGSCYSINEKTQPVPSAISFEHPNQFSAIADPITSESDSVEEDPIPSEVPAPEPKNRLPIFKKAKISQKERKTTKPSGISGLVERVKPGLSAVTKEEWMPFTATVDSGASEHVVPPTAVNNVKLDDGQKKGCEYEVADGGTITNLGERRCLVGNEFTHTINRIDLQVTDVHKPLLSVAKMVDAGQRVVFDPTGSYVEDTITGEQIPMDRKGGVYEMRLWAKQFVPKKPDEDFHRQR